MWNGQIPVRFHLYNSGAVDSKDLYVKLKVYVWPSHKVAQFEEVFVFAFGE